MMTVFLREPEVLIDESSSNRRYDNVALDEPVKLYLAIPKIGRRFEFLQRSKDIVLDTNHPDHHFLLPRHPTSLTIPGGEENYGSLIRIEEHNGQWLVLSLAPTHLQLRT